MANSLEQLKAFSKISADTGDFEAMKEFAPETATTNPALILAAAILPQYKYLIEKSASYGSKSGSSFEEKLENALDILYVLFGVEISKIVSDKVAVQVDPRLSFDKERIITKALKLIQLFESYGVSKERVLIKIGATWEGIQAAKALEEKHGVHCNLTLMFSFVQAVAGAEVGVTMLSPFVGGVLNWHVSNVQKKAYTTEEHPGVQSTIKIYNYFKKFGYKTAVMGAYLTNLDEVKALAGCDYLTIGPDLLGELKASPDKISVKMSTEAAQKLNLPKLELTEAKFRWLLNEDQMATEQLADGIRTFTAAAVKLENIIRPLLK